MGNISINFLGNKKQIINYLPYFKAELKLDQTVKDQFMACIKWWSKADYERQWQEGLDRLKDHKQSCLISNIRNLDIDPWIEVYNLYKVNGYINIQSSVIFGETFSEKVGTKGFTIENCYDYIQPRFDDPNDNIDQWFIPA